ncbi:UvrD-helicase domain-containing protein [Paracrocinitomix mangrovi]|uniref:ATP-dependent helicase n=1 Tax=Paracrocinitomix mangrovi TaxID=2862509 RepID=UPI001C8E69B6|nr:UvrD-helicase domain-containing protein [Paracrocinitomix mangrovi]UKN03188.1 UvrD-helicase domain-containing protein [Paracrocinitomix mangrovi]
MRYLETLNPQQLEAVKHTEGPSMVIAGAGSGKTRVLTFRIAYLIENGVDPFNILALTFTNKAAREMKSRIASIVGASEAKNISMGTFHSVFARILRHHSDKLGYPSNFTIYDTQDSRSLLKTIIKELKLDDKTYKPSLVHGRISSAKNNLISAAAYEANTDIVAEDRMSGKPRLFEIYKAYEKRCFMAGAMDFDDLLYKTNVLLRDHPDVLHFYQQRFRYILVDEYQDTNYAQYLIVKKLADVYQNICVVGDDAQSIYSFRGANIENILNFRNDYPDCVTFKLEQNYRSTKTIVNAANSIIQKNKDQIEKTVWTDNDDGNKIKVIRTLTDNEEGKVISNMIHEVKYNEQAANEDFAILYRTNAQSRSFEEALRKLNLPYKIYGGLSFYQRKEIKDLLAYFRLTANPNDEEALKRVINYPKRGIGKTTIEKIIVAADHYEVGLWDVITNPAKYPTGIPGAAQNKISSFVTAIKSYQVELEKVDAYELAQNIAKSSGITKELYDDKTPEGVARYENIQALLAGIKEFTESVSENETAYLSDFMIDVALLTDADEEKEEDKDKITLMTIHASKGLEFPYVFIVGMEENLFPSQMSLNSRSDLEEERRLFYVALTRAEKKAVLSYATSRYRWGNLITSEPSRFIEEIDTEFLEINNPSRGTGRSLNQMNFERKVGIPGKKLFSDKERKLKKISSSEVQSKSGTKASDLDLKVGYNVMHEKFGKGKVVGLDGSPPTKATVFFPKVGNKQLLLKFAKLEILD